MDHSETQRHLHAVQMLCDSMQQSLDKVEAEYMKELNALLKKATVKDYLPILISRKVRQALKNA